MHSKGDSSDGIKLEIDTLLKDKNLSDEAFIEKLRGLILAEKAEGNNYYIYVISRSFINHFFYFQTMKPSVNGNERLLSNE